MSKSVYAKERYFDRDLSWIDFNYRVLSQALDPKTPLLERLKFSNIFISNNDEFFMKRIHLLDLKKNRPPFKLDRKTMKRVTRQKVEQQLKLLEKNFNQKILNELAKNKIKICNWKDLNTQEKSLIKKDFRKNIFPILTPLAVGSEHPFPFMSNLSKN